MLLNILYFIRRTIFIPVNIILYILHIYVRIALFFDYKNYAKVWEEKLQKYIDQTKSKKITITKKKFIRFYSPNTITSFRSKTLFTKEPETIDWLNQYGGRNKILYDIGANIGIYSLYYSKKFNASTYSFEPSFKNLVALSKNIYLNKLENLITVIPNAVTHSSRISNFYQLNFSEGEAGAEFNDNIKKLNITKKFFPIRYNSLGLNLDNLIRKKIIKIPDLIKIDVDGNELDVILSLKNILKKKKHISILIEIDKNLKSSKLTHNLLNKFNFSLVKSRNDNFIFVK